MKWLSVDTGLCPKQVFENVTAGHNSTLPLNCEECELGVTAAAAGSWSHSVTWIAHFTGAHLT